MFVLVVCKHPIYYYFIIMCKVCYWFFKNITCDLIPSANILDFFEKELMAVRLTYLNDITVFFLND